MAKKQSQNKLLAFNYYDSARAKESARKNNGNYIVIMGEDKVVRVCISKNLSISQRFAVFSVVIKAYDHHHSPI